MVLPLVFFTANVPSSLGSLLVMFGYDELCQTEGRADVFRLDSPFLSAP